MNGHSALVIGVSFLLMPPSNPPFTQQQGLSFHFILLLSFETGLLQSGLETPQVAEVDFELLILLLLLPGTGIQACATTARVSEVLGIISSQRSVHTRQALCPLSYTPVHQKYS